MTCPTGQIGVIVQINTQTWANEVTWQMDDGQSFGPYADNAQYEQALCLEDGEHKFKVSTLMIRDGAGKDKLLHTVPFA